MMSERIETARLVLRQIEPEDLPSIGAMHADPEVMRHAGDGKPLSEQENWRLCAQLIGHWKIRGYGMYVMEEKQTGEFCGLVGMRYPPIYPGPEIGWRMPRQCWGKGLALEGASAVRDHAFKNLRLKEVFHLIEHDNSRSIRLAEKLGAVLADDPSPVSEQLRDHLVYRTVAPAM